MAATSFSPFKVRYHQRGTDRVRCRENLRLSLPSPAITWIGEVGGINCGGDMRVRRCLARSFTSLALRCALQRVQTVPAAIHSGRIPPTRQPPTGDGRLRQNPSPHRTRSVLNASSKPQLNLHHPVLLIQSKITKKKVDKL